MKRVFYRNRWSGRKHSCSEKKWEQLKKSIIGKDFEIITAKEIKPASAPYKNVAKKNESKPAKEPAKAAQQQSKIVNNSKNGNNDRSGTSG